MPPIHLAVKLVGVALTVSRHPLVRAAMTNPKTRDMAVTATRNVAYNAGVIARHIVGRKTP